ncbi:MAG TPA: hypothetical protein PLI95_11145 [Polyangiaceae bacterium]|nr:hypothetical protein [Polyangiaceae bacterium]
MASKTRTALTTLTIDIGGQGIKGMTIQGTETIAAPRHRLKTPRPATSDAVIDTIVKVIVNLINRSND